MNWAANTSCEPTQKYSSYLPHMFNRRGCNSAVECLPRRRKDLGSNPSSSKDFFWKFAGLAHFFALKKVDIAPSLTSWNITVKTIQIFPLQKHFLAIASSTHWLISELIGQSPDLRQSHPHVDLYSPSLLMHWACNSVVECPLRMREVLGSNPSSSKITFTILSIVKTLFLLQVFLLGPVSAW